MKPFYPIFIIGPGRSGTTLLYKLLSLHPDIGYVNNYDVLFARWVPTGLLSRVIASQYRLKKWAWFSSDGNAYTTHRIWLKKAVPTPTEGEKLYSRCGLSTLKSISVPPPEVVSSLRKEFIWLQTLQNTRVILSKRTVNNRRLPSLAATFPEARYICIVRDGRSVAQSLINVGWWENHAVWWADNKTPREIARDGSPMLAIAARNWKEEIRTLQEGLEVVPKEKIKYVRYEALLKDPLQKINDIIDFIGVKRSTDYDEIVRCIRITERPEAWTKWSEQEFLMVMQIQREFLKGLKYV